MEIQKYKNLPSKEEQTLIWNTECLLSFHNLNFDMMLDSSNLIGVETFIKLGFDKDSPTLDGYEFCKKHANSDVNTIYFMRTEDSIELPIIIQKVKKIRYSKKIYNLVEEYTPMKIKPEKLMSWRELINCSGVPMHTKELHYTLYKNVALYGRLKDQVYYRIVSESKFGKDKYKESLRILLGKMRILSDPSRANVYYSSIFNTDLTICELPSYANAEEFNKMVNQFIRIGDHTKVLDNPSRAKSSNTDGTTFDISHIEHLSLSFLHNVPKYYHDKGKKGFDDIYPYNLVSRFYYVLLEGFMEAKFPHNINYKEVALKNQQFIKDWIKTCLWYEIHWNEIENPYPDFYLNKFIFRQDSRFKDHFIDMAKCFSQYAENETEYMKLLIEYYKCHKNYDNLINNNTPTQLNAEEINLNMFHLVKK